MDSSSSLAPRAVLFKLDPALESELSASLREASYVVSKAEECAASDVTGSGIVFCPRGKMFAAARAAYPYLPVVIVSRLPDTAEWLDALEQGAADYIAPPFESIQMRWLLKVHEGRSRAATAGSGTRGLRMPKCA